MHNVFTSPGKTYIELDQPDIYQRFMREYLELLRSKLLPEFCTQTAIAANARDCFKIRSQLPRT
jgi:hypothetical protein